MQRSRIRLILARPLQQIRQTVMDRMHRLLHPPTVETLVACEVLPTEPDGSFSQYSKKVI